MISPLNGRWDLTVQSPEGEYPSWLELTPTDSGWAGRFVGQVGSARPIPVIHADDSSLEFELPPQYEGYPSHMRFQADLVQGKLVGKTWNKQGVEMPWTGVPAPALPAATSPLWGEPLELIGKSLDGWVARTPESGVHWAIQNGSLVNSEVGSDLYTERSFGDFHLVAEYSYPKGANSGIYLRGRYEMQVLDDYGQEPSVGNSGGIYGFLCPPTNPVKPHGQRNVAEITLLGRYVSLKLNGVQLFENEEVPGITGGALDSAEGEPGPIYLQGDHGPVTFHRLTIRERV